MYRREEMSADFLPAYIRALSKNRPRRKVGLLVTWTHFVTCLGVDDRRLSRTLCRCLVGRFSVWGVRGALAPRTR